MAREVFTRRPGKPARTGNLSVSTEGIARRRLVDPGDYPGRIVKAELVSGDGRNISVALDVADPATGDLYDLRPAWVSGPNAANGSLVSRNLALIGDLLAAVGIPANSYRELNSDVLAPMIGRVFDVALDLDRGARGGTFNTIVRVYGLSDDADVVPFHPAAN
jgi:hypothetical protein